MNKLLLFIKDTFLYKFCFHICKILGHNLILTCEALGEFSIFFTKLIKSIFHKRFFLKNLFSSLYINGFCSIPVVGLTGIFTGGVLTVQLFDNLHRFGLDDMIPYIVMFALMKELAPVLCGLMIVARVSSSMAAEIGSMQTNNQIDSLTSMSISKYSFLYLPRVLSMVIAQPFLTTIAIIMGVLGSCLVACHIYGFTESYFLHLIWEDFEWSAYIMGITKGAIFGALLSIIACYKGNQTKDGAVGIKKATISSVVISCVFILMFNFIITAIMS